MSLPRMTRPAATAEATPRTGVAMAVIMSGVLMTAVDTTIVVLALPEIQRGLHVSLSAVIWVIISFLLVITLLATQVGRLGDMFGRVRMYETGFGIFVLGSLACALAWNEASIIAFRVVQGTGGAFIMANSGAVIADLYPRERRGRAYGFTSVAGPWARSSASCSAASSSPMSRGAGSSGSTCRWAWPRSPSPPGCCATGPSGPAAAWTCPA